MGWLRIGGRVTDQNLYLLNAVQLALFALFCLAFGVRWLVKTALRAPLAELRNGVDLHANTVSAHTAALRILQEHDEQHTVRLKALSKAVDDAVTMADEYARDATVAVADSRNTNNAVQELITEVKMLGEELARVKSGPMNVERELDAARERGRHMFPAALPEVNVSAFGTSPLERPASIHRVPNPTPVAIDAAAQEDQELAAIARLDGPQKHLRLLVLSAKKASGPEACCKCVYFDLEEGQAAIQQFPVFASAARHVLPNRMDKKVLVDDNGDKLPDELQPTPMLPARLNTWELFGACTEDNSLHHAVHTCPSFKPIARTFAGQEVRA